MTLPKIKMYVDDFCVSERLNFALSGDGEHLWCYVEKAGMNTSFVKRRWSTITGCAAKDIAHSGLKDRHAVTQQWLSLPAKYAEQLPQSEENGDEYWRILKSERNNKKLRIGTHRKNAFVLRVREISPEHHADIEGKLAIIRQYGFPNHFGAQRFGQRNIEEARSWVAKGVLPKKRDVRARVLSTLRSELFNAQLKTRIEADNWQEILSGEQVLLAGSNSHFAVEKLDDELRQRAQSGDIAAGGWLAGKGEIGQSGEAGVLRQQALLPFADEVAYLQKHADSSWRALSVRAGDLNAQWEDEQTLLLSFELPRGSYATALLDALLSEYEDVSRKHTSARD